MRTLLFTLACWLLLAGTANAADVFVTRTDDPTGLGNCPTDCSLRQAIEFANSGDRIRLAGDSGNTAVYYLSLGTLLVSDDLTFQGGGATVTAIDGGANNGNRILKVVSAIVDFNELTFQNAFQSIDEVPTGGDPVDRNGGAAIFNDEGEVTLNRVVFEHNFSAASVGAGISTHDGTLSVTDTDFRGGNAHAGSAIFARNSTVVVNRSTIRSGENTRGEVYLASGTLNVTNSTVTDNGRSNSIGGGVVNAGGTLSLASSTLAGNIRGGLMTYDGATTQADHTLFGRDYEYACVPNNVIAVAGPPVTNDVGHNLANGASCGLTNQTSQNNANLPLAPVADNRGRTPTMALLYGNAAINAGGICPPADQRNTERQGACDVGAFEAEVFGAPTVSTIAPPVAIEGRQATVAADFNLSGEAGALRIDVGQQQNQLFEYTTIGVGTIPGQRNVLLQNLEPGKTYFYRATAINATGETPGAIQSFTTTAAPPDVSGVEVTGTTDTGASVTTQINPNGAATGYVVKWTSATGSGQSGPFDAGAGTDPVTVTRAITGLKPGTAYEVEVLATNALGSNSGLAQVETMQQVAGHVGQTVTLRETGDGCPPNAFVNWGDGSRDEVVPVTCDDLTFMSTLTATHVYAKAGRFHIEIAYENSGSSAAWAQISATLAVARSGAGRVTGPGIDCGDDCSEQVAGETVTLTATPDPGSLFDGWEGACSDRAPTCTVTLDADRSVTARFSTPQGQVPTASPTPTQTATPTPTPELPIYAKTIIVTPSGPVLVKPKGSKKWVPLKPGSLPLGAQIDATKGRVTITSIPKPGAPPETATFYGGIFTVTQSGGITILKLSGPEPTCKKTGSASAGKKVKKRKLWGDGKGAFRTSGKYSAATVRGTRWLVEDSCAGTLTRVATGVVSVRDNVRGKTITLRAGKRYLARPRGR